ncbi:MAG: YigZ family protein [Clostridiales bacterium]|nr:YigZ family protein [Clostridiales bacterium]
MSAAAYSTVRPAQAELTVKRSRFLGYAYPVRDEDELKARVAALKALFKTATHICYGAVYDKTGAALRFSDDGEPGGTAGKPILDAIRGRGLCETLVAVVRWFGGVKLGTGGLSRAYGDCAAAVLDRAEPIVMTLSDRFRVTAEPALYARAERGLRAFCTVQDVTYGEKVVVLAAAPGGSGAEARLNGLFAGKGVVEFLETAYVEEEKR